MPAYISRYKKVSFSIVLHIHVCVFFFCLFVVFQQKWRRRRYFETQSTRSRQAPAALWRLRRVVTGATVITAGTAIHVDWLRDLRRWGNKLSGIQPGSERRSWLLIAVWRPDSERKSWAGAAGEQKHGRPERLRKTALGSVFFSRRWRQEMRTKEQFSAGHSRSSKKFRLCICTFSQGQAIFFSFFLISWENWFFERPAAIRLSKKFLPFCVFFFSRSTFLRFFFPAARLPPSHPASLTMA